MTGDYEPISDYAIIGDGHTAALVSRNGSIDWCCWPYFDSGAVFLRLLDARRGGWFRVGSAGRSSAARAYVRETNVLATTFETETGRFRLTDFMPIEHRPARRRGKDLDASRRILRLVEGISGTSRVAVSFRPTFDYARAETDISIHEDGAVARAGAELLAFECPGARLRIEQNGAAEGAFDVEQGDRVWMALCYGDGRERAAEAARHGERDLRQTTHFWQSWIGNCAHHGPYADLVRRSMLALKLLICAPSGALVAAPTTSLPEEIGGVRNWDYRYAWLRDSSLILHTLETVGYYDEAINFFEWLESLDLKNRGEFQIMYTTTGSADLPERTLDHLEGYRCSRPVRIGNAAKDHEQLDIYGEVLDAAYLCFRRMNKRLRDETWHMLSHLADEAAANWSRPDRSIWEMRGAPRHFVYSKLMCWVALDRAIRLADELRLPANTLGWSKARDEIRAAILDKGYNPEVAAFTQSFGATALDASALMVERVGFLPPEDPRVRSTCEQIEKHLTNNGLVYRYLSDDGLPGREGAFVLCTFWLVDNLAAQGRIDEARSLFERTVKHANDVGLLSEEIEAGSGELLGNFPQGFTHLGLIRSASNIGQAESAARSRQPRQFIHHQGTR